MSIAPFQNEHDCRNGSGPSPGPFQLRFLIERILRNRKWETFPRSSQQNSKPTTHFNNSTQQLHQNNKQTAPSRENEICQDPGNVRSQIIRLSDPPGAGVTARIFEFSARRSFPGGKLPLVHVEVFLGKVLLLIALVSRSSGTFPGPTVEIFRRWIFSGLGIFLRNSVYSYATNHVVAHHMY